MASISKTAWKLIGVEIIGDTDVNSRYIWLNEKHMEKNRT